MVRLNKSYILIGILSILLLSALIWQHQQNRLLALQLENSYQRAALEMAHRLANLQENFQVLNATNSPERATLYLAQGSINLSLIKNSLSQLPFALFPTQDVESLLNEMDGFLTNSFSQTVDGELVLDYAAINSYHNQVKKLSRETQEFVKRTQNNEFSWLQIQRQINREDVDNPIIASIYNLFNTGGYYNYPNAPRAAEPQWYTNGQDVDNQEALTALLNTMSLELDEVVITHSDIEETHGDYPGYDISLGSTVGNITGHVTKRDGRVTWFLWDKEFRENLGPRSVTYTQADRIARNFLTRIDENIKITEINRTASDLYYEYTFACSEGDILCYSAQIWLRIAKDDGNVVGFNSTGYLFENVERAGMADTAISPEQALSKVSSRLQNLVNNGPVIFTLPTNQRVLAYEIAGTVGEDSYLVYINANTGAEEYILTNND